MRELVGSDFDSVVGSGSGSDFVALVQAWQPFRSCEASALSLCVASVAAVPALARRWAGYLPATVSHSAPAGTEVGLGESWKGEAPGTLGPWPGKVHLPAEAAIVAFSEVKSVVAGMGFVVEGDCSVA